MGEKLNIGFENHSSVVAIGIVAFLAISVLFNQDIRDSVLQKLHPTADRAYAIGLRHFDVISPRYYDLEKAEFYFKESLRLNPAEPAANHQLARISFLKSDFFQGLQYIKTELTVNPHPPASSYYVKGLIEGYMGEYDAAAKDYETYLRTDPKNWAAINDYAWVLLKADRFDEALIALDWGLIYWPENPWLLNSKATALYELKRYSDAQRTIFDAARFVMTVKPSEWSHAYPGNDPLIAKDGLAAFQKAVIDNMHTIALALQKSKKSMR